MWLALLSLLIGIFAIGGITLLVTIFRAVRNRRARRERMNRELDRLEE